LHPAADLFALLSTHEACPIAPLEAALAGVPLLLSQTGNAEELVGTDGAGIVVPTAYARPPWETNRWELALIEDTWRSLNLEAIVEALRRIVDDRAGFRARAAAR